MAKYQEIRATFDKETITVYQAYAANIALPAVKKQQFSTPFSFHRMTWLKLSFLWMMARSNWATKSNQEHILAIKIKRTDWDQALSLGILTHSDKNIYASGWQWEQAFAKAKVHVQWDPERSLRSAKLNYRTIQVGISRHLIEDFNNNWLQEITDITPLVHKINTLRKAGKIKAAKRLLPVEKIYPIDNEVANIIGISL